MKITAKTTREMLKNFLGANAKAVKEADKDLYDRIAYADKMIKADDSKVSRKDLADLAKEVMTVLGDKVVEPTEEAKTETPTAEPKAENSVKLNKKKKAETTAEPKADEPKAEKVDEKKSTKKSSLGGKKKEAPKKDGVTVLEGSENHKAVQLAKMFPQTIEVEDTKYELAKDINTMEDLHRVFSADEDIVLAFYWTKRLLKQFSYFGELLEQPESFENDLDICALAYVSDEMKVAYALSRYTEAFYTITPEFILEDNGLRYANGVEFQIYKAV